MEYFAELGENYVIQENVVVGFKYKDGCQKTRIGSNAVIRAFTVIYADGVIGDDFKTGYSVLIREKTKIGKRVIIGTNTVIDGNVEIGNFVKLESNVYIPTRTRIGSYVFIGPGAVLTNDKYPQRLRDEYEPLGPILEDSVTIGANATILPGIRIGEGSMVAAGSVVTKDVPPWSLAVGVPAKFRPLPERLKERNRAKSW
jgi:acetyltransferase-like isoleucine patch superfamily enzyme